MSEDIRKQVLQFVNGIRADLELPPVDSLRKGVCKDASHCTIAESIHEGSDLFVEVSPFAGDSIDGDLILTPTVYVESQEPRFVSEGEFYDPYTFKRPLPEAINKFALDFDKGEYPDLVR